MGSKPLILLDTHALVWWVNGAPPLSARARRAVEGAVLAASAISVLEIATAVRRGRLRLGPPLERWVADIALLPELRLEPVSAEIALLAGSFDESVPPDPADRIIAATAIVLGAKLVSADRRLRRVPHLEAVW